MSAIIEFLKSIGEAIVSFFGFVVSLVRDLINLAQMLAETVVAVPEYMTILPAAAVSLFVVILAVVVVCRIAGREG